MTPSELLFLQHASAQKAFADAAASQEETEGRIMDIQKEITTVSGGLEQKRQEALAARDEEKVKTRPLQRSIAVALLLSCSFSLLHLKPGD